LIPGNFISPDFNNPEDNFFEQLNDDVEQLELWLQKNKPDLAIPWGKRVDSLLQLRLTKEKNVLNPYAGGRENGHKAVHFLHSFDRVTHKNKYLYEDDGVLAAVREYLNVANRKISLQGVCEATVIADLESVNLRTIQRFESRPRRWINIYINGFTEEQQKFVKKQEGSHRRAMEDALCE
jgi:hypothetical protein